MFFKCKMGTTSVFFILFVLVLCGCSSSPADDDSSAQTNGANNGGNDPQEEIIVYDMVITGGRVIDPETGRDEIASVGIKDGAIRKIISGKDSLACEEGCEKIDASGLIVSPGFINTHTHEGSGTGSNMVFESSKAFVQDGITFWLGGNCGLSATGVELKFGDIVISNKIGLTMPEYLVKVEEGGLFSNYGTLTGNITLRGDAGLAHQQEENDSQIEAMVDMLRVQMALGTFGVSFGPFYDPGTTAKAMSALAAESKKMGGMSAIHMRMPTFNTWNVINPWAPEEGSSNGPNLILYGNSVTEAIDVCRESNAPMIISHVTDVSLNGSLAWVLDKIDKAINEDGLPIAADMIGFDSFSNDLLALTQFGTIPPRVLMTLGGIKPEQLWPAEDIFRKDGSVYMKSYEKIISVEQAEELVNGFLDGTLKTSDDSESLSLKVWCNIVAPNGTKYALKKPFVFMGNDGGVSINKKNGRMFAEPRTYACFSRLIGHWSRDEQALGLKDALFKATIAPALWLGLSKKGRLQEGCDADIVIFDKDAIIDRARPEDGKLDLKPEGLSKVIVNGQVVVDDGELTGKTPGRLIRRTWIVPGNTKKVIALYNKLFSD
jgi:N-acyl-D-amino-acid deacylase